MAFEDDWLYGGRVAFRFGRAIELQPFYFVGRKYGIDAARAPSLFGAKSAGRTIDLQHYGVTTQINLAKGNLVPFLRGGGGIMRFEPDSGRKQDRLAVTAGGGVRFGIGQLQAEIFAEQMGFRLDPQRLFSGDSLTGGSSVRQKNLVYGGAITIPISNAPDADEATGLRGATAPIEPFVGRMRYDGSTGLSDQNVAGVRGGIDFSPLFGVRGFYWRGVNEDRNKFVSVEGYGAEGQFNLNTGPGISPYVIAGAGRINYSGTYRDSLNNSDNSRDALIVGAGASFQLSERLRFKAAIRDYVIARNDSLEAATTTGDLTHNRMLTAGFTISLGGSGGASDRTRAADAARTTQEKRMTARDAELRAMRDSTRAAREDRRDARRGSRSDMRDSADRPMQPRTAPGGKNQPAIGDRWITVPVPAQGEIILRYGFPPIDSAARAARPGQPRDSALVRRDTVVMMPRSSTGSDSLRAQLAELESRLMARIESMRQPQTVVMAAPTEARTETRTVIVDTVGADRFRGVPIGRRFSQVSSRDLQPFAGFSAGDAGTQAVLSLRMRLGEIASGLQFVPEFAVGVGGDGTSVLALANVQYAFQSFGGSTAIRPYVTGGAGIFSPKVLAVNIAVGASMDLRHGRGTTPWLGYLELQGLNLFRDTRLMLGVSIR
ncbi:MAG: outer membrane beta-barrel protein [Gemmatimonadaceae bacterium]|nr:outer membrane beta-barrel protein [Gemmatimonadaceae bacterium]